MINKPKEANSRRPKVSLKTTLIHHTVRPLPWIAFILGGGSGHSIARTSTTAAASTSTTLTRADPRSPAHVCVCAPTRSAVPCPQRETPVRRRRNCDVPIEAALYQ